MKQNERVQQLSLRIATRTGLPIERASVGLGWGSCFQTHSALAIAGMLAMGCTMPVHAGALYKCMGDDGIAAYVSEQIKGAKCSVILRYETNRPHEPLPQETDGKPSVRPETASTTGNGSGDASVAYEAVHASPHAGVVDFGDPAAAAAVAKIRQPSGGFRYVQIGDSHTAGDFLTDQLRMRLQARLGNGGMGWAMPMQVPGQRLARVSFEHNGWELISSRKSGAADYPFGGLIAQVVSEHAVLTIKSKQGSPLQRITAIIRQGPNDAPLLISDVSGQQQFLSSPTLDGRWHKVTFGARLPLTVVAEGSQETAIGGWWLSTPEAGAIVSAVGINGAKQSQWNRWRSDWMQDMDSGQPNLIAIAYGTNEAFDEALDEAAMRNDLGAAIDQLRERFPHAAVLILGAPESLSAQVGSCGVRAPSLDAVQRIQKEVAENRKAMFWDWQHSMGGACSMKRWISEGLARSDGVHFTPTGYAHLGDLLYQGLVDMTGRSESAPHQSR